MIIKTYWDLDRYEIEEIKSALFDVTYGDPMYDMLAMLTPEDLRAIEDAPRPCDIPDHVVFHLFGGFRWLSRDDRPVSCG